MEERAFPLPRQEMPSPEKRSQLRSVIPAQAGIQKIRKVYITWVSTWAEIRLDSCFRRNDKSPPSFG